MLCGGGTRRSLSDKRHCATMALCVHASAAVKKQQPELASWANLHSLH